MTSRRSTHPGAPPSSIDNDAAGEVLGPAPFLPLAVVEVVPLLHTRPDDPPTDNPTDLYLGPQCPPLSAPMVKMQLRNATAHSIAASEESPMGFGTMRMILDSGEGDDHNNNQSETNIDSEKDDTDAAVTDSLDKQMQSMSISESTPNRNQTPASRQIIGGDIFLSSPKWIDTVEKELGASNMEVPVVRLMSDDPTDLSDGVPCWIRGYASITAPSPSSSLGDRNDSSKPGKFKRETRDIINCAVMAGTLVRILPPIPSQIENRNGSKQDGCDSADQAGADVGADEGDELACIESRNIRRFVGYPETKVGSPLPLSLYTEVCGEVDPNQFYNSHGADMDNADFTLASHDAETVHGLIVRMQALLDREILVGTTEDAIALGQAKQSRRRRRKRAVQAYCNRQSPSSSNSIDTNIEATKDIRTRSGDGNTNTISNLFRDGALTLHDSFEASGKTKLVQVLARHVLNCSAVHTFDATTLFSKYGVNGADNALESLLHSIVLSAAVGGGRIIPGQHNREKIPSESPPSICIILDHLETFVPPSMLGIRDSGGEPSVATLNAIVAYLTKLTRSIKNAGHFPFPTKNPMYNLGGSSGFVFPVRLCIVGIVTCDDDIGHTSLDSDFDSYTVLNFLGSNRYRLAPPSARTRYEAFSKAFEEANIKLSDEATDVFPTIAASATGARGRDFHKAARHLFEQLSEKENGKVREATAADLRDAMTVVTQEAPKDASINVTFLSSKTNGTKSKQSNGGGDIFSSVGGNAKAKLALEDALALDPRKRNMLTSFGLSPPIGVLLYGPPGTGKTLLARATALALESESAIGGAFINMSAPDIVRGEVGRSEKLVVSCFELARANTPAVIFIDEFQSIFMDRGGTSSSQLSSTLLRCMDDVSRWRDADAAAKEDNEGHFGDIFDAGKGRIVVLGATNVPWMIDKAFLRPGRFDRVVHVGLPNMEERESILQVYVGKMNIYKSEGTNRKAEICQNLAKETEGLSGADLSALCRMAAIRCLQDKEYNFEEGVKEEHFSYALKHDLQRSCSDVVVEKLKVWTPRGS